MEREDDWILNFENKFWGGDRNISVRLFRCHENVNFLPMMLRGLFIHFLLMCSNALKCGLGKKSVVHSQWKNDVHYLCCSRNKWPDLSCRLHRETWFLPQSQRRGMILFCITIESDDLVHLVCFIEKHTSSPRCLITLMTPVVCYPTVNIKFMPHFSNKEAIWRKNIWMCKLNRNTWM